MNLINGTEATNININPQNSEYSGLVDFKANGLAEGDYRVTTRETPFGGINYIDEAGGSAAAMALGIDAVQTSASPNIIPNGEYNIDIADEVPFMATFADFADPSVVNVINGVNPTGRNDIDVNMDITTFAASINAATEVAWTDIGGAGNGTIVMPAPGGENQVLAGNVAFSTKASYDVNMDTHFTVTNVDTRDLLASNVDAVTYYRSAINSTINMNLTYKAQATESIVAETTYLSDTGAAINLNLTYKTEAVSNIAVTATYNTQAAETVEVKTSYILAAGSSIHIQDHDLPGTGIDVDVSGKTVDEAAAALGTAINSLDGGTYMGVDFTAEDGGAGQWFIRVTNASGKTIDILDKTGTAGNELGILTGAAGQGDSVVVDGTSRDLNRSHIFNVGNMDINGVAAALNAGLGGAANYNTAVAVVNNGDGTSKISFNNTDTRHRVEIANDILPASVETELGLNGYSSNPNSGLWSSGTSVFHNYTFNVACNNQTIDQVATTIQNGINAQNASGATINNVTLSASGGTLEHVIINNNSSKYKLTLADTSGNTAAELGLAATINRGIVKNSLDIYNNHNLNVAAGNISIDGITTQLNNSLNTALGLDGLADHTTDCFIDHDNGDGTHVLQIDNTGASNTLYDITISNSVGTTAAELGLNGHTITRNNTDNTGTAKDFNREHTIIVDGQAITQIAATIDTALAAYNIDAAAVDLGGGLRRLQITNNSGNGGLQNYKLYINSEVDPSLEAELNIGNTTANPDGDTILSKRVYHNYTCNINVGDRHLDDIAVQLNSALAAALTGDDLVNPGMMPFQTQNTILGEKRIRINNAANNTRYEINLSDAVGQTAIDLGLNDDPILRGEDDQSGISRDYNKTLGTINSGNNVEEIRATVDAWGVLDASWINAANTPGYDGLHHNGIITFTNNDVSPTRREVVFLASAGSNQLFGSGGDISINPAGATRNSQGWQARDRIQVRTDYSGITNAGVLTSGTYTYSWFEGDNGIANPLVTATGNLPFDSVYIPDADQHSTSALQVGDSWSLHTSAFSAGAHDCIDTSLYDSTTGRTFTPGGLATGQCGNGRYVFNDGVLDNNGDILLPQLIRTGTGSYTSVNHDIDFGTISSQNNAVRYSERYNKGTFNQYAHAAYGSDTTYYFANGGDPADYLQNVEVWRQEDDNCSLLFTVLKSGPPPVVQVEGKGYNRDGSANDFTPVNITLNGGAVTIGCIQFDNLTLGGNLSVNDKFVINVAARAGGGINNAGTPQDGYYSDATQSDACIAITGNPWMANGRGSTMEYRFEQDAENGKSLNLLGYFVHPTEGNDNAIGVWAGQLLMNGIGAAGFNSNTRVGTNNVAMEINYNGSTEHIAASLLTGYYFNNMESTDSPSKFLDSLEYNPDETQNAAMVFEVIDTSENQVTLRGQAHIYGKDGSYRYANDEYIVLGKSNNNVTFFNEDGEDGLTFDHFDFSDLTLLKAGDRFSLSCSANAEPADSDVDEIYLFSSTNRRDLYPHAWRFNEGVLDNKENTIRTYQVNYETGDISDSTMDFEFKDFHGGSTTGILNDQDQPRTIRDTVTMESRYQQGLGFGLAHHYSKLKDISAFWANGKFLLESPQQITVINNGKKALVNLYADDEIVDVLDRINHAVYEDLGQNEMVKQDQRYKFVSFVDSPDLKSSLEKVEGTIVIRTAIAGDTGSLAFQGEEDILRALGLTVINHGTENHYDVEVHDAYTGKLLGMSDIDSGYAGLKSLIHNNIKIKFKANLGIGTDYNEDKEGFTFQGHNEVDILSITDKSTMLHVGANQGQNLWVDLGDMSSTALNVDDIQVITHDSANKSLGEIDKAIEKVSTQRAILGALQNRLDHTTSNLSVTGENMTSTESRIRDVDIAKSMMSYIKQNILTESAVSILVQTNQKPKDILMLLGK
ncbi:MAG: flagellin [Syntrophomonas sp.]